MKLNWANSTTKDGSGSVAGCTAEALILTSAVGADLEKRDMASKYDRFWQERLAELRKELGQAAMGKVAGLDVAVIKKLG